MNKTILVVLDACRPDALIQAHTPYLDSLWLTGAYTWTAQATVPSYTLPCHMSMFRGVPAAKHGVTGNTYSPSAQAYPSILEVAHAAGKHVAVFHSWEELRDLAAPGNVDLSYYRAYREDEDTDAIVARIAADYVIARQPDLTFLYLARPDYIGHLAGWMSPAYLAAIEQSDRDLGVLLERLTIAGIRDRFTLLILSDHGGHGHDHGSDLPEDLLIPWILNGPSIRRGYALTTPVRIYDTAATLAALLDLPVPPEWDGAPVREAWASPTEDTRP